MGNMASYHPCFVLTYRPFLLDSIEAGVRYDVYTLIYK